jgi:hypothetical protein
LTLIETIEVRLVGRASYKNPLKRKKRATFPVGNIAH